MGLGLKPPRSGGPWRVGLTGGIGSGKSTVAGLFAALGVATLDTDALARALMAPGQAGEQAIRARFGSGIWAADGQLDRAALRRRVFASAADRRLLEDLLHPLIGAELERQARDLHGAYCVLAIPLLLEAGWRDRVDRVLVVDVPEATQVARTMARNGLTAAEVEAIMHTQASRAQRLAGADDVVRNDADLAILTGQIRALHARYLGLARAAQPASPTTANFGMPAA